MKISCRMEAMASYSDLHGSGSGIGSSGVSGWIVGNWSLGCSGPLGNGGGRVVVVEWDRGASVGSPNSIFNIVY